ncbi:MAG TPA: tetratricopeptide repeat protein, partial [Blastocatellia bacterium]
MRYISRATLDSKWGFRRRLKIECLTVGLMIVLPAGTPLAAVRSPVSLHPSATRHPSSAPQILFDGAELILEGQALMKQQTRQAVTQALAKFKEAVALSQRKGNKGGMGAARLWEGIAYDWLGKPREALRAFLDASRYLKESGLGFMTTPMTCALIGVTCASLGETDKALDYLNQALPALRMEGIPQVFINLLKSIGYERDLFLAYALKGLGDVNVQIGQKRKGLEYLNEALGLYQRLGDWLHEIQALALISTLKSSLGQPTEAIKFAQAAIDRSKEKKLSDWEAYGHFALGAAYSAVGNLDQAEAVYKRSLELLQGKDDSLGEALALNNLGLIYVARGDFNSALDHFERASKLAKASNEPRLAAYA